MTQFMQRDIQFLGPVAQVRALMETVFYFVHGMCRHTWNVQASCGGGAPGPNSRVGLYFPGWCDAHAGHTMRFVGLQSDLEVLDSQHWVVELSKECEGLPPAIALGQVAPLTADTQQMVFYRARDTSALSNAAIERWLRRHKARQEKRLGIASTPEQAAHWREGLLEKASAKPVGPYAVTHGFQVRMSSKPVFGKQYTGQTEVKLPLLIRQGTVAAHSEWIPQWNTWGLSPSPRNNP